MLSLHNLQQSATTAGVSCIKWNNNKNNIYLFPRDIIRIN